MEDEQLPIGMKNGCLTIIGELSDYSEEIKNEMTKLDDNTRKTIVSQCKMHPSQIKAKFKLRAMSLFSGEKYKCQCKCGQIHYLSGHFFQEKRYRDCGIGCGLIKIREQKKMDECPRRKADDYNIDYTGMVFESYEVLECIDDIYEVFVIPKYGEGVCIIHKLYKCRCYLCGKKRKIIPSSFKVENDEYGDRAKEGYYSNIYCDCHKISSFQWRTVKILQDHGVKYRVEYSFPDLYGIEHKKLLRYDFAIFDENNNIKYLIECQGEQHYRPVKEFGGDEQYEVQVKNDEIKRLYAKEHNIPLIEIKYTCNTYEKEVAYLKKFGVI